MEEERKVDKRTVVVLVGFAAILVLTAVIVSITFSLELVLTPKSQPSESDGQESLVEPWSTVLDSWDGDLEDDVDPGVGPDVNGQFLVLSDVHLDLAYTHSKGGQRFCRDEGKHGPSEACYTSRFDYDDDANYQYGQYGCDTPLSLLASCLTAMVELDASPDFVLVGGDLAMHCSPSYEATLEAVRNATAAISSFFPDVLIIPTIGNNDVFPEDQIAYGPSLQLSDLADAWAPWIRDEDAVESFRQYGYFSVSPVDGLRVISLNTLYYTEDWCPRNDTVCTAEELDALVREDDPNGQFAWLEEQLKRAVSTGEGIILTGHMSPGRTRGFEKNWFGRYQDPFMRLVEEHHEHIAGAVFGHIHRDGLMILEVEEAGSPVNLNTFLVNSALSPREKQNPSFRSVRYRHRQASLSRAQHGTNGNIGLESFAITFLNLTEVYGSSEGVLPIWREEYDFANAYGASDRGQPNTLRPPDVQRVVHDIFEDEDSYEEYLAHWATLSESVSIKHAKAEYLCSLIAIENSAYNDCVDLLGPVESSAASSYDYTATPSSSD